jgi:hypothetical protein
MDNQDQNEQADKPAFKPAKNPFLSAVGIGTKQTDEPPQQQTKEVVVGNKSTTMVGALAQDKSPESETAKSKKNVPEEIMYDWQAPEFAFTQKPFGWYLGIFAFFLGLSTLAFFFIDGLFQKILTIALLVIMAVATAVWAGRRPRVLNFKVTNYGISLDEKKFSYDDFRAFYVFMDYNQESIALLPAKRFGTLISLPLTTPEAEDILETISHMVPETEHNEDIIDKLVRRLRF